MWLSAWATAEKHQEGVEPRDAGTRELKRRHTPHTDAPAKTLSPVMFADGSFLTKFAEHCIYKGVVMQGRPAKQRKLRVASLCTGSCSDGVAMDVLQRTLAKEGIDISFETPFIVENNKEKIIWCTDVHKALAGEEGAAEGHLCAFDDVSKFCSPEYRYCYTHKKNCELPLVVDGVIAGFSCKDFSRANKARKQFHGSDVSQALTSPGASAQTMHGVLQVLDKCVPDFSCSKMWTTWQGSCTETRSTI